ncbi:hypothetical protein HDU67_008208, partial [Dinochytrium kinnereticum]
DLKGITLSKEFASMRSIAQTVGESSGSTLAAAKLLRDLPEDSAPGEDILLDDNLLKNKPPQVNSKSLYMGCNPSCSRESVKFPASIQKLFTDLENQAQLKFPSEENGYTGASLSGDEKGKITIEGVLEALMAKVDALYDSVGDDPRYQAAFEQTLEDVFSQMESEELTYDTFLGAEIGRQFISAIQNRFKLNVRPPPRQKVSQDPKSQISDNDVDQTFRELAKQFQVDVGKYEGRIERMNVDAGQVSDMFNEINRDLPSGREQVQTRDDAVAYMQEKYKQYAQTKTPTRLLHNYVGQTRYQAISGLAPNSNGGYEISSGIANSYLADSMNLESERDKVEFFTPSIPDELVALDSLVRAVAAARYHASKITDPQKKDGATEATKHDLADSTIPDSDTEFDPKQLFATNLRDQPTSSIAEAVQKLDNYVEGYMKEPTTEEEAFILRHTINTVRQAVKYMQQKFSTDAAASNGNPASGSKADIDTYETLLDLEENLSKIEATDSVATLLKSIDGKTPSMAFDDYTDGAGKINSAEGAEYKGGTIRRVVARPKITLTKGDIKVDNSAQSFMQKRGVTSSRYGVNRPGPAKVGTGQFRPIGSKKP